MKQFLKDNWFKIIILIIVFFYLSILFLNFLLEGKRYNLNIYKDSVKFCYDLAGRDKDAYSICKKAIERFSLSPAFFIDNRLQKQYEREKSFWSCYGSEWNKNHNSEEVSKYCSQEADKTVK